MAFLTITSGLLRSTTEPLSDAGVTLTSILKAILWDIVIWWVVWPNVGYLLQHAHFSESFNPFLQHLLW